MNKKKMPDQVGHDKTAETSPAIQGIKIKAKARSFCQTIENFKDRNENKMPGESRLVPLRVACNGGTHVCLDGFRFFHRNQKLAFCQGVGKA
ncbi:hypothetical protein [Fibrobacter sp. UWCM]|uniref:hypothetical protein n=1 Tax=Fibrobacter sp. UWCM TaxID=1896208 RepID=UPI0011149501|nr:hypothetical protein [Fibrobacter sp. UWCM]